MKTIRTTNYLIVLFAILLFPGIVFGVAYIPDNGNEIIVILDKTSQRSRFENLNLQLQKNKHNPVKLVSILQDTIQYGKSISDPRYIGFVSSFVDSYLKTNNNIKFKVLKASILQHGHQFSKALNLLNSIIKTDPAITNARLLRASILQVQAKYASARQDCYSLLGKTSHLVTISCIAQIDGLTKDTKQSYSALKSIINRNTQNQSSTELSWSYDILAQLARQLGNNEQAEQHFKEGLILSPDNVPLLNAYADLLISDKKFNKVMKLLRYKNQNFTILLRLAITEKLSSNKILYKTQFLSRLHKMQATSDFTHLREIAAFYLFVEDDIKQALSYATRNWELQKELYDAQLLLNCAIKNQNLDSAQSVIKWYVDNSIFDVRINNIIRGYSIKSNNNTAVKS